MIGVILVIFLITLLIVLTSRIKVELIYIKEKNTNHLIYQVSGFKGLFRLKRKTEFKVKEEKLAVGVKTESTAGERTKKNIEMKEFVKKAREFLKNFEGLIGFVKDSLSRIRLVESNLVCDIGSGDAVTTAQYVGLVWTLYGSAMSLMQNTFDVTGQHDVVIMPDFNEKKFQLTYGCIFDFRLGHFIVIAIQFIFKWQGRRRYLFIPVVS